MDEKHDGINTVHHQDDEPNVSLQSSVSLSPLHLKVDTVITEAG